MKDISKGYIALFRQFTNWEWFTDVNTCHLFIYCLLKANHKNTKWRGIELKKGQFVTSYQSLSEATGLSIRNIRTSLKKLTSKTTNELTHKATNHYSIITVNNWILYQKSDKQSDKQTDNQVTTDNKQINTTNISYINSSSSSIREKITEEEEEILKNYCKRNKVLHFHPWLRKVLNNGDYKEIITLERDYRQKESEKINRRKKLEEEKKQEQAEMLSGEELARLAREQRKKLRG